MPLRPGNELLQERICNFGVAGVGKSTDFYTIPALAHATGSDMKFHIIDSDYSAEMMLSDAELGFDEIPPEMIEIEHVDDWESLMGAFERFQGVKERVDGRNTYTDGIIGPQDWLLVDMLTPAWTWVQDWYTRKMWGQTLDEYFMEARSKRVGGKKAGNPFADGEDNHWTYINNEYGKVNERILKAGFHVFATAEQKGLPKDADKAIRSEFGPIGFIPAGQKRTPHLFHSCFHKTVNYDGEFEVTSAKNRSRPKLQSKVVKNFAKNVLVGNRGWKLS